MHFSAGDIELLGIHFPGYALAAESRGSAAVSASLREAAATVAYTDALYFWMHFMSFAEGGQWLAGSGANIIVLKITLF